MKLRVHHLLCSALFAGKGYSDAFVENMQSVVDGLFSDRAKRKADKASLMNEADSVGAKTVSLSLEPDIICAKCPNLTDGACCLDDNNVISKDAKLAERLGLTCGRGYPREALLRHVAAALREEIFEDSCHKCRWYAEGLCSYDLLREAYRKYANQ